MAVTPDAASLTGTLLWNGVKKLKLPRSSALTVVLVRSTMRFLECARIDEQNPVPAAVVNIAVCSVLTWIPYRYTSSTTCAPHSSVRDGAPSLPEHKQLLLATVGPPRPDCLLSFSHIFRSTKAPDSRHRRDRGWRPRAQDRRRIQQQQQPGNASEESHGKKDEGSAGACRYCRWWPGARG